MKIYYGAFSLIIQSKYLPVFALAKHDYIIYYDFDRFQVVAIATYCGIIVPRAHLLAEAVTQGIFMAGMYQLFCLLVAYCGGEAELVRKVKPNTMDTRVGPCCCWPCCCCLPSLEVNKYVTT